MAYRVGKIRFLNSRVCAGSLAAIFNPPVAALVVYFLTAAAGFLLEVAAAVFICRDCRGLLAIVGAVEVTVVMQNIARKVHPMVE